MLAAEGTYVVMMTIHGPQMGLHVAVACTVDHGGVAKEAAESHGWLKEGGGWWWLAW
jgi:hypothetical protein